MSSFKELNIGNPGTASKYGGNDTDLLNKTFNGVIAGIPPIKVKNQNKFGFWDSILFVRNQADSRNTVIRGQSNVPATDVDLILPPITANDTLATIGLQNVFSVKQQFNAGVLHQAMAAPANPSAGFHHIYVDSVDGHLKRKDSTGAIRDYDINAVVGFTIDLGTNILTEAGRTTGAILKHDGTEYTGLPRGTANQVLVTNAGATDVAWATLGSANLPNVSFINAAATFTAMQTFKDNLIQIQNPAGTFEYIIRASAITADRNLTIPLLTANDTISTLGTAATFTAMQTYKDNLIQIQNPTSTFSYIIRTSAITADRNLTLPLLTADDTILTVGTAATLPVTYTGMQTFKDNLIQIQNPAGTFEYIFRTSAITADREITLPLLTANDTIAVLGLGQTFTGNNTFSGTTTISGAFTAPLLFNNNIQVLEKDSVGTNRQVFKVDASNNLTFGDSAGFSSVFLFSGAATAALQITNTNQATFTKLAQSGVAEVLAEWRVSDSANTSYIRFGNLSSVDAVFRPRILISNSDDTGANEIVPQVSTAMDTGTNAILKFTIRHDNGTVITTRPLMDILNNTTSVLKINVNGDITQTVIAQAGIAETIHSWEGPSDADTNSFFRIYNASNTDATFAPKLVGSTSKASTNALMLWGWITVANDTGTTAILNLDARRNDGTAVTTRPLLNVSNQNTDVLSINPSGRFTLSHTDEGVNERLVDISLSDASGSYFRIENNIGSVVNDYAPMLRGHRATANATYGGLYIQGSVDSAQDTGLASVMTFDSRAGTGTVLLNRSLFVFRNAADTILTLKAYGDLFCEHRAQTGAAETLQEWRVQDSAGTSFMRFANISSADGVFVPRIFLHSADANSSIEATVQCTPAMDTSTNPLMVFNCRQSTPAALATRPLFEVRNNAASQFRILANGDIDMISGSFLNANNIPYKQTHRSSGSWSGMGNPQTAGCSGIFQGAITAVGLAAGTNHDATNGHSTICATTATIGNQSGLRANNISRHTYSPILEFKIRPQAVTVSRFWMGFNNNATAFQTAVDPLATFNGILVGNDGTNNNWWICWNDGQASSQKLDTGIAINSAYPFRIIKIEAQTGKWIVTIDGNQRPDITTNIPAVAFGMSFQIEALEAVVKQIYVNSVDLLHAVNT